MIQCRDCVTTHLKTVDTDNQSAMYKHDSVDTYLIYVRIYKYGMWLGTLFNNFFYQCGDTCIVKMWVADLLIAYLVYVRAYASLCVCKLACSKEHTRHVDQYINNVIGNWKCSITCNSKTFVFDVNESEAGYSVTDDAGGFNNVG